ncbi:MAG: hypothetical protein HQL07_16295 [Nitrospirae bacterium]|nr:hypothetical protein [Magnetococcales bacterium]HAT51611.1 hypothetical protein [Alphaproteobacteria bacterium]
MILDNPEKNPIFVHYGHQVDRLFDGNTKVIQAEDLFDSDQELVGTQHPNLPQKGKRLADYADEADVLFLQSSIQRLQEALAKDHEGQENGPASDRSHPFSPPTTQKLKEFRTALAKANEAMMEENPFYELTGLLWRLHAQALQKAFADHLPHHIRNMPRPIKVARTFTQIIKSSREVTSSKEKFLEILGKVGSIGKFTLGLFLFIGSTLTTAKGVSDLVQLPAFADYFGPGLMGSHNEGLRTGLALLTGLLLSSAILDFKSRLFQGVAETGKVFPGYLLALRRNPRWVIIALFLTSASIWTNYDGIVLLLSKTEDLSWQWKQVQKQVKTGLGDPTQVDTTHPDSLWDLHAVLQQNIAQAIQKFQTVPDDEMTGTASSGVAMKGPRYWGKYFIVNGGYQPGIQDVAHAHKPSTITDSIDAMLKGSGLDLSQSLEAQLLKLLDDFSQDLAATNTKVQAQMESLEAMMSIHSLAPSDLYTFFNLESYHVNNKVQEVVTTLEENTSRLSVMAERLNRLTADTIALLVKVDQAGGVVLNHYDIHIQVHIPQLEAIEQLKKGNIPGVQRRTLEELKSILLERYGLAIGGTILFFILFIAISMDLSDPIFYSAMVARWGRRDRHFLEENIQRFQKWEREIIQDIRVFLMRPDIRASIPNLPCPPMAVVTWTHHLFLESLDAAVKDQESLTPTEALRFWFFELFQASRIRFVKGYNARLAVSNRILSNPHVFGPRLLNRIYCGLFNPFRVGVDHFDIRHGQTKKAMTQETDAFECKLNDLAESIAGSTQPPVPTPWIPRFVLLGRTLFFKPLIHGDFPFPLTRLNWLREQALLRISSFSRQEALAHLDPILKEFLGVDLPRIKRELFYLIENELKDVPNQKILRRTLQLNILEEEFQLIHDGILCLFGMIHSRRFPLDDAMLHTVLESTNLPEVLEMTEVEDENGTGLRRRLNTLESRLRNLLGVIQGLLRDHDQVVGILTQMRKNLLRPLQTIIDSLHIRDVYEKACGFDQLRHEHRVLEGLVMYLWCDDSQASVNHSPDNTGSNLAMELFRQNAQQGHFSLLGLAQELEVRLTQLKKEMDSRVFLLNYIDQLIQRMFEKIRESFVLIAQIFIVEAQIMASKGTPSPKSSQIAFLEDNLLFLRSVPLALHQDQLKIWSLAGQNDLTEDSVIAVLRHMEKEGSRLSKNLQKILDYLNDQGEIPLLQPSSQFDAPRVETTDSHQEVSIHGG